MTIETLLVFTKYPTPGFVKTRLIPHLGKEKAALVHRLLAEKTINIVEKYVEKHGVNLLIYYTGVSNNSAMESWLGAKKYKRQGAGGLGKKINKAFQDNIEEKEKKVVLIGTDCPDISEETLSKAFVALDNKDIVLGPAFDGGYYLIGLKKRADYLFQDIPWGKEDVLKLTIKKALRKKLKIKLLKKLGDVDRPSDLEGVEIRL